MLSYVKPKAKCVSSLHTRRGDTNDKNYMFDILMLVERDQNPVNVSPHTGAKCLSKMMNDTLLGLLLSCAPTLRCCYIHIHAVSSQFEAQAAAQRL